MRGYSTLWTVIVDCIVLHYMHIWYFRIRASSLQFRASKINMALARMDKLVKKLLCRTHLDLSIRVLHTKMYLWFFISTPIFFFWNITVMWSNTGLDIKVCLIPVKTNVGQIDLVLRLSDGTSEKIRFPNVPVRRTNLFPLV